MGGRKVIVSRKKNQLFLAGHKPRVLDALGKKPSPLGEVFEGCLLKGAQRIKPHSSQFKVPRVCTYLCMYFRAHLHVLKLIGECGIFCPKHSAGLLDPHCMGF